MFKSRWRGCRKPARAHRTPSPERFRCPAPPSTFLAVGGSFKPQSLRSLIGLPIGLCCRDFRSRFAFSHSLWEMFLRQKLKFP